MTYYHISKDYTTYKHLFKIIRHIHVCKMIIYVFKIFNYIFIHLTSHLYVALFINQQIHVTQNNHKISLQQIYITTHSTGFPSHIGVQAYDIANFEPYHVIPCTCTLQNSLPFWYFNLCDMLTDSSSQCSSCTVSLVSNTACRCRVWA